MSLDRATAYGHERVDRRAGCPSCGGEGGGVIAAADTFDLVRCPSCGLVYSDPAPEERVLAKYEREYDLAKHFGPLASRKRILYEERLTWIPTPVPGRGRLCDVGCGDGQFLELAARHGWLPFGVEMNPPAARAARDRGCTIFEGRFEALERLPWGTFDLVTSWDSLEHVADPRTMVTRMRQLLRPSGVLALTTLNVRSLAWWVFRMRWSMVVEDHFTYWTRDSLVHLLEGQGFRVEHVRIFGLGRDFVDLAGAVPFLRPRAAADPPGKASVGVAAPQAWDTKPVVLRLESWLNRLFDRVGGGVGLGVVARRRD